MFARRPRHGPCGRRRSSAAGARQAAPPLAGVWTLNRPLSEFPADIGFNPAWMRAAAAEGQTAGSGRGGGGRGRQSGGGGGSAPPFGAKPESYEDARAVQLLTSDVRTPAARPTIVDTLSAVTMTNELGQSWTVHPDGRQESIDLQGVTIAVTSKRDGDRLVVLYRAGKDREIRYTYSHSTDPSRLTVEVQFLERGTGDKARRVYDPAWRIQPRRRRPGRRRGSVRTSGAESIDQRPGRTARLKSLGILVEDLSSQAVACGLNRDAIGARCRSRSPTPGSPSAAIPMTTPTSTST